MPELPEVENIKQGLKSKIINKKILDVEYSNIITESHKNKKLSLVKDDLDYFKKNLLNKEILDLERRGKYVYFTLNKGFLIAHFGMTGAFFVVDNVEDIKNKNYFKHKHIIFSLNTGEKLVYSDIRRFGELRYIEFLEKFKPFLTLAPEPFEKNSLNYFLVQLEKPKYLNQKIKAVLLEGEVFCGCGNIYACEVLYKEKIHPETLVKDISINERKKLFKSLVEILDFSIKQGGSTISDFVHSDGSEGNMQNFLKIYGKKQCLMGHAVESVVIKTRNTHFCPICQKL